MNNRLLFSYPHLSFCSLIKFFRGTTNKTLPTKQFPEDCVLVSSTFIIISLRKLSNSYPAYLSLQKKLYINLLEMTILRHFQSMKLDGEKSIMSLEFDRVIKKLQDYHCLLRALL